MQLRFAYLVEQVGYAIPASAYAQCARLQYNLLYLCIAVYAQSKHNRSLQ